MGIGTGFTWVVELVGNFFAIHASRNFAKHDRDCNEIVGVVKYSQNTEPFAIPQRLNGGRSKSSNNKEN